MAISENRMIPSNLVSSSDPPPPLPTTNTAGADKVPEGAFSLSERIAMSPEKIFDPLAITVRGRFEKAVRARRVDEERWVKAYYNYRGLYTRDIPFTDAEKSRVFVKITKTKVQAAFGQLVDVLLANNRFPITVDPTSVPEGVAEAFYLNMAAAQGNPVASPEDPIEKDRLGVYAELVGELPVKEGEGNTPQEPTFYPAYKAAKKMERQIHDQLEESDATTHLRLAAHEMALLGHGVVKGPLVVDKEYARWKDDGTYDPILKPVPKIEHVSIFDFYPEPEARSIRDLEWCVQRHLLGRSALRKLKKRPHFFKSIIDDVLEENPIYERQWWETELVDSSVQEEGERYEVLEYWGYMDADKVSAVPGIVIPEDLKDDDEFQVNIWVANERVIRCVFNPFTPKRMPYHACPYELNPYNFFGVGVAENMEDCQTLMNGFARLAVDNAILAGNLIIEVDENALVAGQDMRIEPGKVFRRNGGAPGQSIFATKWNSTAQDNMLMFDKFRQIADESVGIPSYSHGQTGVAGTTRTAAGMSMLMGAASLNVKTVIKNVDDYLLAPLGAALFAFNMQFNFDPEIKGDLEVKARGTASLMRKELQSQRLMQFLQITANPAMAAFIKFPYLIRSIAETLDIDPDKVLNNPMEAQLQAMLMGQAQGMMKNGGAPMPPQMTAGPEGAPGEGGEAAVGQDPTGGGGGNIGVGAAPGPDEAGFAGGGSGGAMQALSAAAEDPNAGP